MNYLDALKKLRSINQEHLLVHWELLTESEREHLLIQINALDISTFHLQQQLLQIDPQSFTKDLEPYTDYAYAGNMADFNAGRHSIAQGHVGCLLIAGGQGTRLRFTGPKGLFPITPIKHKTLFQFFAEKVAAAGRQNNRKLPLAIMTSPLNHEETCRYFAEHQNFGLEADQLFIFSQNMLPFLDKQGNLFFENPGYIAQGPDGNGFSLKYFVQQGIWKKWQDLGVRYVNYVLIDNALADPFDAELVGFHERQLADVTVKCTLRGHVQEKVGVLTKQGNQIKVTEYSELPEIEKKASNPDGTLKHRCANLSLFCLSMPFIAKAAQHPLPLHLAYKSVNALGKTDEKAWKFETFIFDLLPVAQRLAALLYPRERCFAPLKNYSGEGSPDTVRQALLAQAKMIMADITKLPPPEHPFELSADFYYPTLELLSKWLGGRISSTQDYIDF